MTHRIVRSLLTVFVDDTPKTVFDFNELEPVALAQSYTLDTTKNTQSLTPNDLADPTGAAPWNVPEPTDKGWTLSTDALVLLVDAAAPEYDPTGKIFNEGLFQLFKLDDKIWVAIVDSDAVENDVVPLYGQAVVTGFSQNGNMDEFHTYTMSFEGVGELLDSALVPAPPP